MLAVVVVVLSLQELLEAEVMAAVAMVEQAMALLLLQILVAVVAVVSQAQAEMAVQELLFFQCQQATIQVLIQDLLP
jgi:hypothetical protein